MSKYKLESEYGLSKTASQGTFEIRGLPIRTKQDAIRNTGRGRVKSRAREAAADPPGLSAPLRAPTRAAGVRMTAALGHGGYVVPGRWNPLRVRVANVTEAAVVEIVGRGAVERFPCRVEEGAGGLECPVYADPVGRPLRVRLVSGGRTVAEQAIDVGKKSFPGHVVLAIDVPAQVQQAIERILLPGEPVYVVGVSLAELPSLGLDYDGVSGIVLADPGPVLNPGQTQALRGWLAGGGRMAVLGARQGVESIAAMFLQYEQVQAMEGQAGRSLGLGSITLLPEPGTANDSTGQVTTWQRLLAFKPFADSARLTAGRGFPEGGKTSLPPVPVPVGLVLTLAAWTALAVILGLMRPRLAVLWFVLFTTGCSLLVVPIGSQLGRAWHRGAAAQSRVIILPDDGGTLASIRVQLAPGRTAWTSFGMAATPWGVDVRLAGGTNTAGGAAGRA